ncbi:hypothetical protein ATO6_15190 [Oceanicola sp. 22II-s10i]|nr:hypothetical protein ATO6_15190 [Oceanicola sp. 22II-s10i]
MSLTLRALARYADRVAFDWDGRTLTYAEVAGLIGAFQSLLRDRGVGQGSRVVILSTNRPESWCLVIAVQGLGGAISMLHPLGSLESHVAQIEELGAKWVIADTGGPASRAAELAEAVPQAQHLTFGGDAATDLLTLAAAVDDAQPVDLSDPMQPAAINFTGGTTGRPKAVVRYAGALGHMATTILGSFELPEHPRYLPAAPISHVAGTKIIPVLMKGGTVFLDKGFDAGRCLAMIEEKRINMILLVPTMIYALLDHPEIAERDLSSLELLLYGASPMSPTRLAQGIERFGPVFAQVYGQTECYPIAYLPRAAHDVTRPADLEACGFPAHGVSVALLDADCVEVPEGVPGEICVRGPNVMAHYLDRPEETAAAFEGNWLHTGDVAVRNADGRLTIVDRKKDMIVTGGFNVYPKEVENVLMAHPSVSQAAVIGVPDAKWGEAVFAYVVLAAGYAGDADELGAFVKARKGSVLRPRTFAFVDALPLSPLGKVDKKALRAPHWDGRSRQV